jgi:tetratricopeptide (TPR) repeat protein
MNIGLLQKETDKAHAREYLEKAQAIREKLLAAGKDDPKLRRDLAKGYFNLAALAEAARDVDAAERSLEKAREVFEALAKTDRSDLDAAYQVAACWRKQADLKYTKNQPEDALRLYLTARNVMTPLAGKNPDVAEYQVALAEIHMNLATTEEKLAHRDAALTSFEQAQGLLLPLLARFPTEAARYRKDLIETLRKVGTLHPDAGRRAEALKTLETLHRQLQQIIAQAPGAAGVREQLELTKSAIDELHSAESNDRSPTK